VQHQFINLATGSDLQRVCRGLRGCTSEVTPTLPFDIGGRKVILLDTPGFDDTSISDFDILDKIADYMNATYAFGSLFVVTLTEKAVISKTSYWTGYCTSRVSWIGR
jgi:hypothetical protein